MSLIFWQPQSGLACLSIKMVRLVNSGSRLPGGVPLGLSISPAGPSCSNFFFQANSENLEMPTKAAKSAAGRPLRCHVSSNNNRCSGCKLATLGVGTDKERWRCRLRARGGKLATSWPTGVMDVEESTVVDDSGWGLQGTPHAAEACGGATGEAAAPGPLPVRRPPPGGGAPPGGGGASGGGSGAPHPPGWREAGVGEGENKHPL